MTIEQENTSIVEKKDYQLSKTDNRYNDSFIDKLNEAEKIADYIANSKTFSTQFETQIKDSEGMLIRTEVNKADIIACILLGKEIGLQPMAAIVLGKKLNAKSYFNHIYKFLKYKNCYNLYFIKIRKFIETKKNEKK